MQNKLSSPFETLSAGVGDYMRREAKGTCSNVPLLLMDPIRLIDLLQICTSIAQGQQHLSFVSGFGCFSYCKINPVFCCVLYHLIRCRKAE